MALDVNGSISYYTPAKMFHGVWLMESGAKNSEWIFATGNYFKTKLNYFGARTQSSRLDDELKTGRFGSGGKRGVS